MYEPKTSFAFDIIIGNESPPDGLVISITDKRNKKVINTLVSTFM